MTTHAHATTTAMTQGRRADSTRRRQRVLKALNDAVNNGEEISGIAHRAGVDRSFLYRPRDLLEHVHAAEAQPRNAAGVGPTVSQASLQADLLAAQQRCARMAARTHQLETRLSELLDEQAWRQSGSAHPTTSTSSNNASTSSNSKSSALAVGIVGQVARALDARAPAKSTGETGECALTQARD